MFLRISSVLMLSSLLRRTPSGLLALGLSSHPGPGSCPQDASLRPRSTGSASALPFSKLAQCSLALRPEHSLSCSKTALFLQCLIDFVSSINPPGGSGWSVSSRVGLFISPTGDSRLFTAHWSWHRLKGALVRNRRQSSLFRNEAIEVPINGRVIITFWKSRRGLVP